MNIDTLKLAGALALAGLTAPYAIAAPPAAPQVTTGASTKQLRFDWDIVPQSNNYELWFKANDGSPYVKVGEYPPWRTSVTVGVSAHLLDWQQAKYQLKACNPSGCSASAPISVAAYMADTIGYFKARHLHNNGRLGIAVAISEDGNTMAAFSAEETLPDFPKAAVYVFAKINGHWQQQAHLVPESSLAPYHNVGIKPGASATLSLSADGNVLAAGMAFRNDNNVDSTGVTVYRRSGGKWRQEFQKLREQAIANPVGLAFYEIDAAGEHILFRPGTFMFLPGTFDPTELLVHTSSGWTSQQLPDPPPPSDISNGYLCPAVRLSGDGKTIARVCTKLLGHQNVLYVARSPDWQLTSSTRIPFTDGSLIRQAAIDYAGKRIAISSNRDQVLVFDVNPADGNQWSASAPMVPGAWNTVLSGTFGLDLSISHDGGLLAILDPRDTGQGTGVLSPPLEAGTDPTGATYIYELRADGPRLRRVLKPNNPVPALGLTDGRVGFASNGRTLVVSEPEEPGNSSGIDGDRTDVGRPRTGALWLY